MCLAGLGCVTEAWSPDRKCARALSSEQWSTLLDRVSKLEKKDAPHAATDLVPIRYRGRLGRLVGIRERCSSTRAVERVEVRFVVTGEERGVMQGYLLANVDGKWVSALATTPSPVLRTMP
jgi:hypothetical protein